MLLPLFIFVLRVDASFHLTMLLASTRLTMTQPPDDKNVWVIGSSNLHKFLLVQFYSIVYSHTSIPDDGFNS
jgi:hypothetical protein